MTSLFRLISRTFDPPATVENAGVRPSEEHVAVSDLPAVEEDFRRLAQSVAEAPARNSGAV